MVACAGVLVVRMSWGCTMVAMDIFSAPLSELDDAVLVRQMVVLSEQLVTAAQNTGLVARFEDVADVCAALQATAGVLEARFGAAVPG